MPYKDPEKRKELQRSWYQRNKEKVRAAARDRRNSLRKKVRDYKLERGCGRCGFRQCAAALDPHHPASDGNAMTDRISRWCHRGFAWEKIKAELDACEILCANCHRSEHCENC